MDLRTRLVDCLKEYRTANNYNTYQLRKIERAKEPKPIAGINVTTLNRIEKEPNFSPSKKVIISLCDFLNIDYELDSFGNPKLKQNEKSSKG